MRESWKTGVPGTSPSKLHSISFQEQGARTRHLITLDRNPPKSPNNFPRLLVRPGCAKLFLCQLMLSVSPLCNEPQGCPKRLITQVNFPLGRKAHDVNVNHVKAYLPLYIR